jgi:hypothetical protein
MCCIAAAAVGACWLGFACCSSLGFSNFRGMNAQLYACKEQARHAGHLWWPAYWSLDSKRGEAVEPHFIRALGSVGRHKITGAQHTS